MLDPTAEYVVILHGLMKLGAVAVPLDPRAPGRLDRLLAALGPRLVLRDPRELSSAPDAPEAGLDEDFDIEAVQCVIHTSGTGGRPKPSS